MNLKEYIVINAKNIRKVLNLFLFEDIIIKHLLLSQFVKKCDYTKQCSMSDDFMKNFYCIILILNYQNFILMKLKINMA